MIDYKVVPHPSLGHTEEEEEEEDNEQREALLSGIKRVIDHPKLLDVTFVCEDLREVRANRTLLAGGSAYFLDLLYGDKEESCMGTILLPTVRADGLQVLVRYLHGCPFRWSDDSSWDIMVDAYLLADRYRVKGLCKRILRLVPTLGYPAELGDLLNAAVPRHATTILKAAVEVLNDVVAFDSQSFVGWAKDSIKYCLENVAFHPSVTETILAEAVISAASGSVLSDAQEVKCRRSSAAGDAMEKSFEHPLDAVGVGTTSPYGDNGGVDLDREEVGSLSIEDVGEVLKSHINLAFVSPILLRERVEDLGILSADILAAVYSVQSVCFARGMASTAFFAMPWRSLTVVGSSIAPLETEESRICSFYREFSVPSILSQSFFGAGFKRSPEQPQQVWCCRKDMAMLVYLWVLLRPGKHIWMARMLNKCDHFGVGISTVGLLPGKCCMMTCVGTSLCSSPTDFCSPFISKSGFKKFDKPGSTVIVIFDQCNGTLTFANDLETYRNYEGEYPVAYTGIPQSTAMYPALSMLAPAGGEIEWIESSARPEFARQR
ncbi:hypothetical protein CBR_g53747 [Chara braunii]|uniref:BTB domain-containing protein n=1 Tax=Chara braunii TaxID=69332 RepID=A0A388MBB8_CHABU|nr:hypothetical protein CBR_g53747 [Chara braunii]|eukprot:GBG91856.1 hypothetical protein CBR_g53747 [Chara braunii]